MSELPKGWESCRLEEFSLVNMGQSPKGSYVNDHGEGMPFYQGKSEFGKLYPSPRKYCEQPTKIAQEDDILLSVRAPVGPTNLCPEESCIGRGLAGIRAYEKKSQQFLLYQLKNIEPWLSQQGTGSTFKAISGAFLRDIEIFIAPLNEQTRIANKLDSLLAKVDQAQTRLERIPQLLKRFRQSVLAAATSGELTREWREENTLIASFDRITFEDILIELRNGLSQKPNEDGDGFPILRISSVRSGEVNQTDIRYLNCDDKELVKYRIKTGDLLFTRYNGSLEFVGVCGLVKSLEHKELLYPDKLIRARISERALPEYIEIYFSSPAARTTMQESVKTTSGQKGISGKDIKSQVLNLPKLKEQKEIVRRVESLFAMADTVEKQYQEAKTRLDRLSQSILAKAFRGELVPQDPNDEPAAELLKRIQAEREQQQAKPKRKAVTRKTTVRKTKIA